MSKKSQPSAPAVPNPQDIIGAETQANRINQQTPFGSLTYGGPNNNTATLNLSPELQNLFNLQTTSDTNLLNTAVQAQPGISNLVQNPLNAEGLPGLNAPDYSGAAALPTDVNQYRSGAEKAFYDRAASLLNPQFAQQEEQLRQTLANQGLQGDTQAFGTEYGNFARNRANTYENLARDAVLYGGQDASRMLSDQLALRQQGIGEAQQGLQNASAIRSQLLGERGSLRSNQFNELTSLLGLQQVQQPQLASFFGPGQANVADAYGLQQNSLLNRYNIQSGNAGSKKGSGANLAGLLGSALISR